MISIGGAFSAAFSAAVLGIAMLPNAIIVGKKKKVPNELKNAIRGTQEHKTRPKSVLRHFAALI